MQVVEKTIADDLILVNIYSLLGFHESAYQLFKQSVDITDAKQTKQLYKLADKASWHKDNFTLKDIRKLEQKIEAIEIKATDFVTRKPRFDNKEFILTHPVVIFNKLIDGEDCEVYIKPESDEIEILTKAADTLSQLYDYKVQLIEYYNNNMKKFSEIIGHDVVADDDWFATLEVYGIKISTYRNINISRFNDIVKIIISCGDNIFCDNYLEVTIIDNQISSMTY